MSGITALKVVALFVIVLLTIGQMLYREMHRKGRSVWAAAAASLVTAMLFLGIGLLINRAADVLGW